MYQGRRSLDEAVRVLSNGARSPEQGNRIIAERYSDEPVGNFEKTHHFFTKDFLQHTKLFADPQKGVFAKTNQVLAEAGLKARFEIHENTGLDGKVKWSLGICVTPS
ncbi:MAG: hypothetical protein R3B54_18670 [Bdellovibrionota bacterium]